MCVNCNQVCFSTQGSNPDRTGSAVTAHSRQLSEIHSVYGGGLYCTLAKNRPRPSMRHTTALASVRFIGLETKRACAQSFAQLSHESCIWAKRCRILRTGLVLTQLFLSFCFDFCKLKRRYDLDADITSVWTGKQLRMACISLTLVKVNGHSLDDVDMYTEATLFICAFYILSSPKEM